MQDAAKISSEWLDERIKLISQGNKSALGELYECVKSPVYSYAVSVLRSKADAEDVLHDVMLRIWQTAINYDSVGKPMGWVISIAKSQCLMRLRKKQVSKEVPLDDDWHAFFEASGLSPEEKTVMKSCLSELSEEERQIVVLHAVSGLKHREIARITGLGLSTVLSKYNRAIKKLRKSLLE